MTENERFFALARRLLTLAVGILLTLAAILLFFDWLLPFSIAFLTAYLLYPLAERIGKKTGMSHAALRVLLLFLLFGGIASLFFFSAVRLTGELKELLISFYEDFDGIAAEILKWVEELKEKLPLGASLSTDTLSSLLTESLKNAVASFSSRWAEAATKLASRLPSLLFALFIFLMALFYFTIDYERIISSLAALVPSRYRERLIAFKKGINAALKGYFRAYFILFIVIFLTLWIAFLSLGVDFAFLLALVATALDSLPAIGIGIILLPWSILLFLQKRTVRALVLLALWLGITLLRRALEPRVFGKALGIHPLLSLVTLYIGFRFFGFLGILLSPFFALALSRAATLYRKKITDPSVGL